jgi:glycosyltransferase involved in cell wall biosynthesis
LYFSACSLAKSMKVLVLYEELAWYFINCINVLCRDYNCEVLILCKKQNQSAPFQYKYLHPSITILDRSTLSESEQLQKAGAFQPYLIFLAGWVYKPYLHILKQLKPKYSVLGFDNQWNGSLKQRLGAFYFRQTLKSHIGKAFVPGKRQHIFAEHLGFAPDDIISGAYCCDHALFHNYYNQSRDQKRQSFPKRFLFVGRYVREKGIDVLWQAFIELQEETPSQWELWCLGKGDLEPVNHEKIKHFGFRQPEEMVEIIKNTGIFVLPSTFEPWGVVVHEYAAAGFPLICTDKVGAGDMFLKDNVNGKLIRSNDKNELKKTLKKFMSMTNEQLLSMSEKSADLASELTPEKWASNLMSACK